MLEELQRRNFAETTIRCYLHGVTHFSRYFRRPPDQLGPEDIRKYQAMLFTKLKYSPNTVILRLASLRFFYIHVLKRGWSIAETPYPKKVRHLPQVLSQEEVLFRASAETLLEVARDPRHLGAEMGFFSVLHSWNQRLQFHPHVHCVLAAGGLAPDHLSWISARRSFFLPIGVLSRVFRGKFVAGLRSAFQRGELKFHGSLLPLAQPRAFAAWLRVLFRHDWVVYSKRPFGGPEHVLRYLGAYTHRVAISNRRLVALSESNVTFQCRDSAHGNKKRLMTLDVAEFVRRFLLHLLPRGFVRIRNFGFLANRQRAILLPLCFQLLHASENITASPTSPPTDQPQSLWNCPVCGGTMHIVERLTAAQLLLRSPPQPDQCAT